MFKSRRDYQQKYFEYSKNFPLEQNLSELITQPKPKNKIK